MNGLYNCCKIVQVFEVLLYNYLQRNIAFSIDKSIYKKKPFIDVVYFLWCYIKFALNKQEIKKNTLFEKCSCSQSF